MSANAQVLIEVTEALSSRQYDKALALLMPLVEASVPGALSLLGVICQLGEGVERNDPKAVELLTRAVELGDGVAAHNLGTIYCMGTLMN
jgi:TPR repeat protein